MKKYLIIFLFISACKDSDNPAGTSGVMKACSELCKPRMVASWSNDSGCICDQRCMAPLFRPQPEIRP